MATKEKQNSKMIDVSNDIVIPPGQKTEAPKKKLTAADFKNAGKGFYIDPEGRKFKPGGTEGLNKYITDYNAAVEAMSGTPPAETAPPLQYNPRQPNQFQGTFPQPPFQTGGNPFDLGNPYGAIEGQNWAIRENLQKQVALNRPFTTQTPYGSQQLELTPEGWWNLRQNLDPLEAEKLAQNRRRDIALGNYTKQALSGLPTSTFSLAGLPDAPSQGNITADRKRIEDQLIGRFDEVNAPEFSRQRDELDARMLNSGIPRDSEKYNREMMQLSRRQNDARSAAAAQALQIGGDEMSRAFDLGSRTRETALGERLQERAQPFSEIGQALGLRGDVVNPQFQPISDVSVPLNDVAGTGLGYYGPNTDLTKQVMARQWQLEDQAAAAARGGGGGGGGGGGATPFDAQSRLDYLAAQEAIKNKSQMDLLNFQYQNDPRYSQPKGPSTSQQLGGFLGGIGSAIAGGIGQGLGGQIAGGKSLGSAFGSLFG